MTPKWLGNARDVAKHVAGGGFRDYQGSFAPQVFEVTDLTIPAGTDWLAEGGDWLTGGQALHSFDGDFPLGATVQGGLFLQVSEPISSGAAIMWLDSFEEASTTASAQIQGDGLWASMSVFILSGDRSVAGQYAAAPIPLSAPTVRLAVTGVSSIDAPIHVVRARAAFLLI